jgi:hypothetical protein
MTESIQELEPSDELEEKFQRLYDDIREGRQPEAVAECEVLARALNIELERK